jgi:hypothetical protein
MPDELSVMTITDAPLYTAQQALQEAQKQYNLVGVENAALKRREQQLQGKIDHARLQATRVITVAEVQHWRAEEERLREALAATRRDRQALAARSHTASATLIEATSAYRGLVDEARNALRSLRARQGEARTTAQPWARAQALDEAMAAQRALAALVGEREAAALAADATVRPDWMRGG